MREGMTGTLKDIATESFAKGWQVGWNACRSLQASDPVPPETPCGNQEPDKAGTQLQLAMSIADRERQQRQAARAMGVSGFEIDTGSNLSLLAENAAMGLPWPSIAADFEQCQESAV